MTDSINVPLLGGCVTFTATGDVQSWIDGGSNFGWRISDADETGTSAATSYASREFNDASLNPVLTVQYLSP